MGTAAGAADLAWTLLGGRASKRKGVLRDAPHTCHRCRLSVERREKEGMEETPSGQRMTEDPPARVGGVKTSVVIPRRVAWL